MCKTIIINRYDDNVYNNILHEGLLSVKNHSVLHNILPRGISGIITIIL